MHSLPPGRVIATLFCTVAIGSAQNFVDLDFSQNIQATNAQYPNNSTLGPDYYAGLQLDFANVAAGVDARVSINFPPGISAGYDFVGFIPDYNPDTINNRPGDDLGVYYRSQPNNTVPVTGGISYTISFYASGSNFSSIATLSDVRILVYDHDGEKDQYESIRAYASNGLTSYQIMGGSGINALHEDGSVRFDGSGTNKSETTAEGGFLVYYQNTSSIRFDMFATTHPTLAPVNNGIFAAFDGNLSSNNGTTAGFNPIVSVPEPSIHLLAVGATSLAMLRRTRSRG